MTTALRLLLAGLALGASLTVRAELAAPSPARGRIAGTLLAALDADRDGVLSAKEIAAAPLMLAALDLNDDGAISPEERQSLRADIRAARFARGTVTFNLLFTLDANQDGDLQSLEIANAVSSLKRLDLNGDGEITPDELRQPVPTRHHV